MFKRANKITALLVAAASMMSVVPAMAADKVADLGNKEGTVKQGVAYADGKYAFYGYRTDDDHTGVYFNKGGDAKDTMDSQLEDYRLNVLSKFGDKYAYAVENSNDDEYLVDLTSGAIKTDETAEEKSDEAKVQLKSELKRAERYSSIKDSTGAITEFDRIAKAQFGDVWYQYKAEGDTNNADVDNNNGTKTIVNITPPPFNDGNTVNFGGKDYVCDSTAVAGQKAKFVITVPAYVTGTTVTVNGKNYVCLNGSAIGSQTQLDQAVLADVKADTTNFTLFSASNAKITDLAEITVEDSTVKEYMGSQWTAAVTKVSAAYTVASSANAVLADAGKIKNQNALTDAVLADIQANTGALSKTFDVKNAAYDSASGKITVPSIQAKELLTSVVNTATAGYGAVTTTLGVNSTTTPGGLVEYTGFTDAEGNYIDANYTANMYVFSKEKGRAVKIENFGEENDDAKLTVNLVSLEAIDQDKDYIYAIAKVDVTGEGALDGTQYFLQKISKASDGKHDGAKLPKSVNSYQLNIDGTYDDDDTVDAAKALLSGSFDDHDTLLGVQVVNGDTVYVTRADLNGTDDDNIKVYKLEMKSSVKADVKGSGFLKDDVDAPMLKKTDDEDQDVKDTDVVTADEDEGIQGVEATGLTVNGNTVYRHPEVSFDVNGNTWVLNKGEIIKFNGVEKKTMFTCDRGMNALDVYDDNSLIAWDMDGKVYTTPGEGKKVTEDNGIVVNPDINKDKFKNGYDATEKKFYKDGQVVTNDWATGQDGKWYLLGQDGTALTGWQQKGGVGPWYLLGADGAMLTGWQQPKGQGTAWYYLNPVNSNGAMKTGWFIVDGTYYYADTTTGALLQNTTTPDGYWVSASGAWLG